MAVVSAIEYKLKNQDDLSINVVRALTGIGDSDPILSFLGYLRVIVENAPEVWKEYLDKVAYYLNGGIDTNNYEVTNNPNELEKALIRAKVDLEQKTGYPETLYFYYLLGCFKRQDWKIMAAYIEVEPV